MWLANAWPVELALLQSAAEPAPEAVMHKDFHASCAVTEWALQVA
jgi:hypothetical protein